MAEPSLLYDRYRIVRKLGSGAFATVYLADDLQMGRPVAIKVVSRSADVDDRVLREAQAAAKLSHHHILTVYEMVRGARPDPALHRVRPGQDAARALPGPARSATPRSCEVGIQLCRALEHAHKRGVVHRDIKPENIMLVDGDSIDVRLMDFGVAQLEDRASITMDGDLVGTLAYMSPEQVEGKQVDSRSDVYSLALTLYEGFTRQEPVPGQEAAGTAARRVAARHPAARRRPPRSAAGAQRRSGPGHGPRPLRAARRGHVRPAPGPGGQAHARRGRPTRPSPPGCGERFAGPRADRDRLVYLGQHLAAGAFALCSLCSTCCRGRPSIPRWPSRRWSRCPAFLALVWPFAGGVLDAGRPRAADLRVRSGMGRASTSVPASP